ncbi:MAG: branched-chain amino acid ABC transporter permease [candidate division WOR-3 bacterium]|nr:branched-chain amino acid ABC transporter permease [candidate division WOR-3 bacterium]
MEYVLHVLVIAGIYVILAESLNLVVGFAGIPAMGHAAFSCIGAYTSALLALRFGVSPFLGMFAGAAAGGVLGLIVAYPALRLKGDYLALATFGAGVIVYNVAKNWMGLTRGPMGLPGIPTFRLGGLEVNSPWSYLVLVSVVAVLVVWACRNITSSTFGRNLTSVREDEIAAIALGKNTARLKLIAFVAGAFFAGIAGSLYAHYITFIDPSSFTMMESITILLMVIFGGMGSIAGSVVGAFVLVLLPELLRFVGLPSSVAGPLRQMMYGLLLVLLMLWRPQGILGKYRFR